MRPIELPFDPMQYLRLEEDGKLYFHKGKYLGKVYQEVDGYYVMSWSPDLQGCMEGWFLLAVGAMLVDMNMPWDVEVEYAFKDES